MPLSGQHLPSVITFRLSDMRPPAVNRRLSAVLLRFSSYLDAGALVSVTDSGIRVHRLPIRNPGDYNGDAEGWVLAKICFRFTGCHFRGIYHKTARPRYDALGLFKSERKVR
jgi:hypothetical protein